MVERTIGDGHGQCLLTELLHDERADYGRQRMAMAFGEINDRHAGPVYAVTAHQAINGIPWKELDPDTGCRDGACSSADDCRGPITPQPGELPPPLLDK